MNKYVVGIDPSMHSTGVAVFKEETLVETTHVVGEQGLSGFNALFNMSDLLERHLDWFDVSDTTFVIEEQVRQKKDRMRMEDFVKLASLSYIIGCKLTYSCNVVFVKPSTWKKQIPKKVHHGRLMANEVKLGTNIKLLKDKQPDIMDAIGIGRWYYANHK